MKASDHNQAGGVKGNKGIKLTKTITINKPARELFDFWRDFNNLPRFMGHIESIEVRDPKMSHWKVRTNADRPFEWDAEIINEHDGELIAWQSVPDSDVAHAGSVRFTGTPHGTEVTVTMEYVPPAGKIGQLISKWTGEDPTTTISEDLNRFKQLMETGEIATNQNRPAQS